MGYLSNTAIADPDVQPRRHRGAGEVSGAASQLKVVARSESIVSARDLSVRYGDKVALKQVSLELQRGSVTSLIGPSGCGKSTFLRSINRMNDQIASAVVSGSVKVEGEEIYARGVDLLRLRRQVGMVFQKPSPFPMSIYDNVALAPRMHYGAKGKLLDQIVEEALTEAALWDEVKDELSKNAMALSGGQQQRLCIARMLAVRPAVILMDEPCSALDPISSAKIEDLIVSLKSHHTIVVVTHNLQQAERISDETAFFMFGELVESGPCRTLFESPRKRETADYVGGRFG